MRSAVPACGLLCAFLAPPTQALDFNASLIVAPQATTDHRASPYWVGPPTVTLPDRSSRQDLELRLREGGFNAQGTLREQIAVRSKPDDHGIVNQLYYDGDLGQGLGYTVGKKVMSWGVGFGFRPLDVVQREDRRGVNLPALVGQPLVALEQFSANTAWTLAWVHPGTGEGGSDSRERSLALHWYHLADGDDLHAVGRLSQRRGIELGTGFARVVGEEWSFHGAALYERRYRQILNPLAENGGLVAVADPLAEMQRRHGVRAVAGAQWTGESGWSTLVEAWYDAEAYSKTEWRRLDALTARQRAMAGVLPAALIDGNIAWSSQAYLATNLLRENLLFRLGYDDRDGFKPYAELLSTPRDGGLMLTLGAAFEGNRQRLAVGLRQLGGAADSVLARAPIKRIVWLEWRLALF